MTIATNRLARTFPPDDLVLRLRKLIAAQGWEPVRASIGCGMNTLEQIAHGGPVQPATLARVESALEGAA